MCSPRTAPASIDALCGAIDGGARLWDAAGPWSDSRLRAAYRWRAALARGAWGLIAAAALLALAAPRARLGGPDLRRESAGRARQSSRLSRAWLVGMYRGIARVAVQSADHSDDRAARARAGAAGRRWACSPWRRCGRAAGAIASPAVAARSGGGWSARRWRPTSRRPRCRGAMAAGARRVARHEPASRRNRPPLRRAAGRELRAAGVSRTAHRRARSRRAARSGRRAVAARDPRGASRRAATGRPARSGNRRLHRAAARSGGGFSGGRAAIAGRDRAAPACNFRPTATGAARRTASAIGPSWPCGSSTNSRPSAIEQVILVSPAAPPAVPHGMRAGRSDLRGADGRGAIDRNGRVCRTPGRRGRDFPAPSDPARPQSDRPVRLRWRVRRGVRSAADASRAAAAGLRGRLPAVHRTDRRGGRTGRSASRSQNARTIRIAN